MTPSRAFKAPGAIVLIVIPFETRVVQLVIIAGGRGGWPGGDAMPISHIHILHAPARDSFGW